MRKKNGCLLIAMEKNVQEMAILTKVGRCGFFVIGFVFKIKDLLWVGLVVKKEFVL